MSISFLLLTFSIGAGEAGKSHDVVTYLQGMTSIAMRLDSHLRETCVSVDCKSNDIHLWNIPMAKRIGPSLSGKVRTILKDWQLRKTAKKWHCCW